MIFSGSDVKLSELKTIDSIGKIIRKQKKSFKKICSEGYIAEYDHFVSGTVCVKYLGSPVYKKKK